ncbi:MAG: hypothetical protein DI598_14870 [Pseudopedobacter saltans]|uniref:DUF1266 domain-containing protein n=1 Tax=Pseudopedobacter saltans TaxID=151895 RepID=A0A2W5GQ87_9SPHI|nr:MAG: hypothetical protein DI598_14870 [Pseudopedobacter saltans]
MNRMKKYFLIVGIAVFAFVACKNDKKTYTTTAGQQGDVRFSIKDDTLAAFLLGGVYTFQGYGGAEKTFQMIKMEMSSQPGDDKFVNNLDIVYRKLFEYPYHQSQKEKIDSRNILRSWWDVNNQHEFHLLLTQLQEKGHEDLYRQVKKVLDENGGANANTKNIDFKKYNLDTGAIVLLDFVKKNYNAFPSSGIRAWDIARYSNLVCLGYGAEYVDRNTGLTYLMTILAEARKDYANWKDYYDGFMLGRRFWGGDTTNNEVYQKTITEMQEGDYSAYKYLPLK